MNRNVGGKDSETIIQLAPESDEGEPTESNMNTNVGRKDSETIIQLSSESDEGESTERTEIRPAPSVLKLKRPKWEVHAAQTSRIHSDQPRGGKLKGPTNSKKTTSKHQDGRAERTANRRALRHLAAARLRRRRLQDAAQFSRYDSDQPRGGRLKGPTNSKKKRSSSPIPKHLVATDLAFKRKKRRLPPATAVSADLVTMASDEAHASDEVLELEKPATIVQEEKTCSNDSDTNCAA